MHHDVLVVGGGAGGLELASRLGRSLGRKLGPRRVLLVDRSVFHIWKPTLHEVAAGTLDSHQEGLSYTVLARRNHFSFSLGEMRGLDTAQRTLRLGAIHDEQGKLLVPERTLATAGWCWRSAAAPTSSARRGRARLRAGAGSRCRALSPPPSGGVHASAFAPTSGWVSRRGGGALASSSRPS
jgi:choline dehydrogenase-like flavoprotein